MDGVPIGVLAACVGLFGGFLLGLAARLGDFCTLGALETAIWGSDQRRLRLWGIVLGVAIIGTWAGAAAGFVNPGASFYHTIAWSPLASIAGGLIFGYGMALAGNCGFGALVRFGGGDLRSLVVLVVMGIFAFVALSGPLAPMRAALFPQEAATGVQGFGQAFETGTGLPAIVLALPLGGLLIAWALAHAPLRASPGMVFWGAAAGAAVVWCLAGTSWLAYESMGAIDVEGPSFTAPIGRTLIYLMTSTAGGVTFSVGSVAGVALGAFAGSALRGLFRWEACEDPRELGRQVTGAGLMGIGGVIALGCSVGQGVTAMATLAWSAPVTLAAIAAGGALGLRHLIGGFQPE